MELQKKDYQVFVHGIKDEASGEVNFIQSPSEVDSEMEKRGLGRSRYMNLHLIEKFSAADNGDFGGSSSAVQETMFESNSPFQPSIDRLDNSKGNVKENIQIVISPVNNQGREHVNN